MKKFMFNFIIIFLMSFNLGAVPEADVRNEESYVDLEFKKETDISYENVNNEAERQIQINYEKEQERIKKEQQKQRDIECYYDPSNITIPSGISVNRAYELLAGTSYQTWEIAQAYVEAEQTEPKVNAIFNISMARMESGHGFSPLSKNNNNITSITVSPDNYKFFSTKYDCIIETNNLLKNSYLNPNGDWFTGYSTEAVGYHYYGKFDGENWAEKVDQMTLYIKDLYPYYEM